jgi:hypothetical protein
MLEARRIRVFAQITVEIVKTQDDVAHFAIPIRRPQRDRPP